MVAIKSASSGTAVILLVNEYSLLGTITSVVVNVFQPQCDIVCGRELAAYPTSQYLLPMRIFGQDPRTDAD